jgi:hypothetical protein
MEVLYKFKKSKKDKSKKIPHDFSGDPVGRKLFAKKVFASCTY